MDYRKSDLKLAISQRRPFAIKAELECDAGSLLALVGPSGSGKSTLLRMLAGLSRPHSGCIMQGNQVWFDGQSNICIPPQRRRVGYVPQHYGLFPHMNALENIRAGLHHLEVAEQHKQAREWLQRMHLDGLGRHKPAELSGGQQQRVALARALAGNPGMLLLDEPFSAVDSMTREKLQGELVELKQQLAIPMVMVTHDLNEAVMLADRMTLLYRGHTLQSGTPREVMGQPVNEAAAQLVGMRNLFVSEIVEHDEHASCTRIRLGRHLLDIPYQSELKPGSSIRWGIPDHGVRFRAISGQKSRSHLHPLQARVVKLLTLGDDVRVSLQLESVSSLLQARIPLRLAHELDLQVGACTGIALRTHDIHILPDGTFSL